jgi:2-polyprenyl-3-methyl-5-hydroxy-6-metoxy-1,4-benzoquinol methylase
MTAQLQAGAPSRRRAKEWFDNDEFWRVMYPFVFSERRFEESLEQVEQTVALLKPRGRAVLDLCCGPGRFSVPLAQKGFAVTGVDRTRFLLGKAKARAKAAKVSIEWIRNDMRDFVRAGAFDAVISMFTSFGYFEDKQDDLVVLRNMITSLRPGGVCLIEVLGKERLAAIFRPTTSERLADGSVVVMRHEIFDGWTRIRNEWIVIRKDTAKSFRFHHTIYSGQELRDRMEQVGFRDVRLYGSLTGDAYAPGSPRLVVVGRNEG